MYKLLQMFNYFSCISFKYDVFIKSKVKVARLLAKNDNEKVRKTSATTRVASEGRWQGRIRHAASAHISVVSRRAENSVGNRVAGHCSGSRGVAKNVAGM